MNILIDFVVNTTSADISAYMKQHNCSIIAEYDHFELVYLVSCETIPPITNIVENILDDSEHIIAPLGDIVKANNYYGRTNPNLPAIEISTSDERDWWKNYILKDVKFDDPTMLVSRKGSNARVYIMDSGIDETHDEFDGVSINKLFSFTDSFTDASGHGTAIASVISGKTCGMSSAQIQVVKIFDHNTPTRQSDLLNALDAILTDFLTQSAGLGIINCSWAIDKNQYLEDKIRRLIQAGLYVVTSAGNNGTAIENVTPAAMDEVLTLGAFDRDLMPCDFSNYTGTSVISLTENSINSGALDGWAPGEQIWVAVPGGGYGFSSGTSIAAAIHSCVLAYNFDDRFIDNELLSVDLMREIPFISRMGFDRKDMLILTDPKYATSVNIISTLINEKTISSITRPVISAVFTVGHSRVISIFNPQITDQVSINDTLPSGFHINANGLLVGNALLADNETHNQSTISIDIKLLDGNIINMILNISVISNSFDISLVPKDDPIIEIVTATYGYCSQGPSNTTGERGCTDDCYVYGPYSLCNEDVTPKLVSCGCI